MISLQQSQSTGVSKQHKVSAGWLPTTGEASKYIIEEAEKNAKIKTYYFNNNEEIVENLSQELRNGDVILVKASNGMKFFEICQKL